MSDQQTTAVQVAPETKAPVTSGGVLAALAPQSIDDAFRLAKALSMAGDMIPQHFQGKPEATMAAIVRGMEIGLAPMQALSNIAVINGRASLWGDAIPALMQRSGHTIDVKYEGEGENLKAVATLIRGDTGKEIVREFSMHDAKTAGLLNKKGPWQQYPKRMLSHRARSWAARDGAADALMGLQIAEEVQDYQPMRDVTPAPATGGFAAKAIAAKEIAQTEPVQTAKEQEKPAEQTEAETEEHTETEEGPEFQPDPFSDAYNAGLDAYEAGHGVDAASNLSGDFKQNFLAGWHFKEKEAAQ
ncbi:MAG: hypothetical protein JXR13_18635 [Thalassovita sp.]